jgi:prefoldin subunit 5
MSFSVHVNTPSAAASGCDPGPIDAGSSSLLDFRSREVQIFLHYQHQSLEHCSRQLAQQETILRDYTTLRTRLATISDQARYPAVIPLGPHAVVRGELVHTNEILVFLGDNYFVERSSKQVRAFWNRI